jgi:hypothetical protein
MKRLGILLLLTCTVLVGCGRSAPQQEEADRVARVVGMAISYPRQADGAGYVRAARDTAAGRDGRLTVVELRRIDDTDEAWAARLTFRVHLPEIERDWGKAIPALTTCYRATFSPAGLVDGPDRADCPSATTWVAVPPAPRPRQTPVGTVDTVERVLRRASTTAPAAEVRAAVERTMSRRPQGTLPPEVEVAAEGHDLGVAVRDDDGCLLGSRFSGRVAVWVLSPAQAQPGEISCTARSALAQLGTRPPH